MFPVPQTLFAGQTNVSQVVTDGLWVYWSLPASSATSTDGSIMKGSPSIASQPVQLVANIAPSNLVPHFQGFPGVPTGELYYVDGGTTIKKVSQCGSTAVLAQSQGKILSMAPDSADGIAIVSGGLLPELYLAESSQSAVLALPEP
jgi:hypothetical protein